MSHLTICRKDQAYSSEPKKTGTNIPPQTTFNHNKASDGDMTYTSGINKTKEKMNLVLKLTKIGVVRYHVSW